MGEKKKRCSTNLLTSYSPSNSHEHTTDDAVLPWQALCQMDVCPLHAAQALLLDGAPVSEVGAMNSLSRAVWRTSHDRFQLQIHNLTVETQPG